MKKLVVLALVSLLATSAFAGLDTDSDMIGVYFDTAGDVVCATAAFIDHVPAYILYTNPTLPTTRGFELGMDVIGVGNTSISVAFPVSATNVGVTTGGNVNIIAGYASPIPTSAATVMATLDVFYLDFAPLDFMLRASNPSSNSQGLPMVVRDDFSLMTVGFSAPTGPAAQINGACSVVENEDASFGAVKALFR